jgi:purine-nucleoside phosphorylase
LLAQLHSAARSAGVELHEGVYAAVTGPCYETQAEIRALRTCGADAVGMSTAREILAGVEAGMECAAISCITNRAAGLSSQTLNHQEVIDTATAQADRLGALVDAFFQEGGW